MGKFYIDFTKFTWLRQKMATWPTTAAWRSIKHDQLYDRGRPRSQEMTKKKSPLRALVFHLTYTIRAVFHWRTQELMLNSRAFHCRRKTIITMSLEVWHLRLRTQLPSHRLESWHSVKGFNMTPSPKATPCLPEGVRGLGFFLTLHIYYTTFVFICQELT